MMGIATRISQLNLRKILRPYTGIYKCYSTNGLEGIRTSQSGVPYQSSIHKKDEDSSIQGSVPQEADAVVIGGGSIGCSTVYHLSKLTGGNVVLLEKDRITSGTTWHTAGILWIFKNSEAEVLMQLQTRDLIKNILPRESGEEAGWINTGTIFTSSNKVEFQDLSQTTSFVKGLGVEVRDVKQNEVNDIHPLINVDDIYAAMYSPGDGTIDPATYCMAYIKLALKSGAKVIENCAVTNILTEQDYLGRQKVCGVQTSMGNIKTRNVINCAGAWAPYIGKMAGVRVPQLTYKHAYVVTEPIKGILNTPMVKVHGKVYIKPQGEALQFGGYEMDPHLITDLPHDFSFGLYDLDWDIFDQHTEAAMNRIPAIADAGIRSTVCGPEAFTSDSRPNMGESPEVRGFFLGSAFNSGGMMLGGGAGRQLAHWVYHGRPEIDLTVCDIRRYPSTFANYNKWLLETCHEKFAKRYSAVYKHDHSMGGRNQRKGKLHKTHMSHGALMGCRYGFERPAYYVTDQSGNAHLPVLDYDFYGHYGNEKHANDVYYDEVVKDCTYEFPERSHKLIGRECLTCRTSAALFDSSYMAKLYLTGPEADRAAKRLLSRDITQSPDGQFSYLLMLNPGAGIEGDGIATEVKGPTGSVEYYVTVASSAAQYCRSYMQRIIQDEGIKCNVEDRTEDRSILSIQGPQSGNLLQPLISEFPLQQLKYGQWKNAVIAAKPVMVGRLSFVGEMGYEIHCNSDDVAALHDVVLTEGLKHDACMAGYRAMESLSSETGFHHWPHTINSGDNPIESRLLKFCDATSQYVGSEELALLKQKPLHKKLACFTVDCEVPLYGHEAIWRNDEIVGHLRHADYAFTLQRNIGYGYVEMPSITDDVMMDGEYAIERMGVRHPAEIHISSPFDPKFNRMMGKYSNEEQDQLRARLADMK